MKYTVPITVSIENLEKAKAIMAQLEECLEKSRHLSEELNEVCHNCLVVSIETEHQK